MGVPSPVAHLSRASEGGLPRTGADCSISKLFTSVAVLQQRDAGKVHLDDPVAKYLPWVGIQDVHPDDEPITVRGLLTHSSGLPRESDYPYWTAEGYPFPTHDEIVGRLRQQQTLYPASRWRSGTAPASATAPVT